MAEIFPFAALRYDASRVSLPSVVTQPYDKITPTMQERYYAASPYNLVRIILGKTQKGDDDENVYTRAARDFAYWRQQGILRRDPKPSIYRYTQSFEAPGSRELLTRSGFIALGRICDYSEKIIFRHEQTLSSPKTDRLNLLRATRAHFGQIFMLYSDLACDVDSLLQSNSPPDLEVRDEYGVQHRLWAVSDPQIIEGVQAGMKQKQLIIADGHHRYETALTYRNEQRQSNGVTTPLPCAPYEKVMMTFVNMDSPGLVILPTHRVVFGADPQRVATLPQAAQEFFEVREVGGATMNEALWKLESAGAQSTAILLSTTKTFFLLRARNENIDAFLSQLSPRQRKLDVVVLHKLILENLLGISEEAIREQRNVHYYREAHEAVAQVRPGPGKNPPAQLAFLLNPIRASQLREVALAGEVMPQKSTDFYPKLLSGLAIYALD